MNPKITELIAQQVGVKNHQVKNTLELLNGGATVISQ